MVARWWIRSEGIKVESCDELTAPGIRLLIALFSPSEEDRGGLLNPLLKGSFGMN